MQWCKTNMSCEITVKTFWFWPSFFQQCSKSCQKIVLIYMFIYSNCIVMSDTHSEYTCTTSHNIITAAECLNYSLCQMCRWTDTTLSPAQPGPTSHTPARKLFQYQCSESDSPCGKQTTPRSVCEKKEENFLQLYILCGGFTHTCMSLKHLMQSIDLFSVENRM